METFLKNNILWVIVAAVVIAILQVCNTIKQNLLLNSRVYQLILVSFVTMVMCCCSSCFWTLQTLFLKSCKQKWWPFSLFLPVTRYCVCLLFDQRHSGRLRSYVIDTRRGVDCSGYSQSSSLGYFKMFIILSTYNAEYNFLHTDNIFIVNGSALMLYMEWKWRLMYSVILA